MVLSAIDATTQRLPDVLTLPLIAAGLAATWVLQPDFVYEHSLAAIAGFASLRALDWLYIRIRHRHGLGGGDAKLFAAAGAWIGPWGLPTVMVWACSGAILAVALRRWREGPLAAETQLPFGPYLALGLWLTWLYGPLQ